MEEVTFKQRLWVKQGREFCKNVGEDCARQSTEQMQRT